MRGAIESTQADATNSLVRTTGLRSRERASNVPDHVVGRGLSRPLAAKAVSIATWLDAGEASRGGDLIRMGSCRGTTADAPGKPVGLRLCSRGCSQGVERQRTEAPSSSRRHQDVALPASGPPSTCKRRVGLRGPDGSASSSPSSNANTLPRMRGPARPRHPRSRFSTGRTRTASRMAEPVS
jgi:hypothetical protein